VEELEEEERRLVVLALGLLERVGDSARVLLLLNLGRPSLTRNVIRFLSLRNRKEGPREGGVEVSLCMEWAVGGSSPG